MGEHIRKLRSLQQTLHAMGELISDRDFSNMLLTSLPKSWSMFITAVNAGLPMLTSDALIAQIMEESKSRQAGSGGTALKGSEKKKSNNSHAGATRGNCRNCGKKGHWVKDCWEPGGDKEGQAPKWFKSQDKAKQTQETNNYNDFAFTGTDTCAAAISASDWLADSAAMTHIARNRSHLIT